MYTLSLHSWKGYLHCIFNEFMPHAINHQLWNVCEGIDVIIGGINLVYEEQPYWSSGLWLFKSNTGIQAVFCRVITISLVNRHWVWINNNILKTSEEFLLHFKKYPFVCNFQCQESKYCKDFWYIELRAYSAAGTSVLNKVRRRKHRKSRTFSSHTVYCSQILICPESFYVPILHSVTIIQFQQSQLRNTRMN